MNQEINQNQYFTYCDQYPERPVFFFHLVPTSSKYDSMCWHKFYHPNDEPAGIPKKWILRPEVRVEMEEEREIYLKHYLMHQTFIWALRAGVLFAFIIGTVIIGTVIIGGRI